MHCWCNSKFRFLCVSIVNVLDFNLDFYTNSDNLSRLVSFVDTWRAGCGGGDWEPDKDSQRQVTGEHGASWTLPKLVGTGNALYFAMSSDVITGEEAWRMGIVQKVVEDNVLEF